jgi:hypothetical protein
MRHIVTILFQLSFQTFLSCLNRSGLNLTHSATIQFNSRNYHVPSLFNFHSTIFILHSITKIKFPKVATIFSRNNQKTNYENFHLQSIQHAYQQATASRIPAKGSICKQNLYTEFLNQF